MEEPEPEPEFEERGHKAQLRIAFADLYQRLEEPRKEFVRDELFEQDSNLWSLFFADDPAKPELEEVELSFLKGAVGLARYQREFNTQLPPEYRKNPLP